ncbi:MAG TPA: NAD(P)H-dependent glycerol-3-phosphate dehydrogenase [Hydrogenophaga sp.]|uniref:NAD(P)H-dependent glycerol-3-phosphate dehydrogenase n=1 Tax=Hydrogenophaga sp. TaxID=1904254 RepID=UPI002CA1B8D0|nr:NAD(P)H-dependent glycerol-3-phosphate dehydrogenase [Hydrogenophaga sp.]HMN93361.1 NAD(P)H-dependent glycerol-3-phosphate dehydrogenase [Hydrogenophaga sp.]HMN94175.1 NAD(P)H-dependent glycerol-3-phosphate dehydrogenase [Hydrogenophaga sp.]HMP10793.1 NAD(P)H-dependent glycerol-3-phosphate dehydrogenase [Hydrogenophaga sp.]
MRMAVLGAGAWGTALAMAAARQGGADRSVSLWARDAQQAAQMQAERVNARYLPGQVLPPSMQVSGAALDGADSPLVGCDLVIVATPMAALRDMLARLAPFGVPAAWLCKGFEAPRASDRPGLLGHEIAAEVAPGLPVGVLSGPSFAQEVARGQPAALVAASAHRELCDRLVDAFHGPSLRVYANDDIVGVEVGGAVKNVLAIATGLCDGLNLGMNARAALVTRGLAEMTRFGLALGARPETFMGLSGLGDLVLTATGDLSRNRRVGQLLAEGLSLQQAVDSLGHVAEGVYSARTVVQRARALGIEMPISEAVVALLDGGLRPEQAVAELMGRNPKTEVL